MSRSTPMTSATMRPGPQRLDGTCAGAGGGLAVMAYLRATAGTAGPRPAPADGDRAWHDGGPAVPGRGPGGPGAGGGRPCGGVAGRGVRPDRTGGWGGWAPPRHEGRVRGAG